MTNTCRICGAPTDAFACVHCAVEIRNALTELPPLVAALADRATGMSRTYRSSSRADAEPETDWKGQDGALTTGRLPGDLDAVTLLREVETTLVGWARHLCEARGVTDPLDPPADTTRQSAYLVRWLLEHAEAIRFDEAAAEIHAALTSLAARLARAVDSMPSRHWAGPCQAKTMTGRCERDVYARVNPFAPDARLDAVIICDGWRGDGRGCGAKHEVGARLAWIMDAVEEALVPLAVLRTVARSKEIPWPSLQTFTNWKARSLLHVRSVSRTGEELFRGGDVLDLVQRWAAGRARSERKAG